MRILRPSNEKLAKKLADHVYNKVRTSGMVRVEDVLSVMAIIVAEQCLEVAKELSMDEHRSRPTSAPVSKKINEVLVGGGVVKNWKTLPATCVFARILNKVSPYFKETSFPPLEKTLRCYGKNLKEKTWANLALTIPEDSIPSLSCLERRNETREFIRRRINFESNHKTLSIAIDSLSRILVETRIVINPSIALKITFETIYGLCQIEPDVYKKSS